MSKKIIHPRLDKEIIEIKSKVSHSVRKHLIEINCEKCICIRNE